MIRLARDLPDEVAADEPGTARDKQPRHAQDSRSSSAAHVRPGPEAGADPQRHRRPRPGHAIRRVIASSRRPGSRTNSATAGCYRGAVPEAERGGPHWFVVILVGAAVALVVSYVGLNDVRWPWPLKPSPSASPAATPTPMASVAAPGASADTEPSSGPSGTAKSVPSSRTSGSAVVTSSARAASALLSENSSVQVRTIGHGGVEMSWEPVDHPELDNYSPQIKAIWPISTSLTVSYRSGDTSATRQFYPFQEYRDAGYVAKHGQPPPDQVWVICVDANKDAPLNVPVAPYVIKADICSDPFVVPSP